VTADKKENNCWYYHFMLRIECNYCLISTSYLAELFAIFMTLHIFPMRALCDIILVISISSAFNPGHVWFLVQGVISVVNSLSRVRTGPGKPGKSWNLVMAFSRTGKSWKKATGPGKSWKSV